MAKVEKINQTNDNITITGDSVTFSDLTITNKDLADYLVESDDMLESLESIIEIGVKTMNSCLLYTSPSPRDLSTSRMPSSA